MKNRRRPLDTVKPLRAKEGIYYRMHPQDGLPAVVKVIDLWGRGRNRGVSFVDADKPDAPARGMKFGDFNKLIAQDVSAQAIAQRIVDSL